jgi:hypothetical protein
MKKLSYLNQRQSNRTVRLNITLPASTSRRLCLWAAAMAASCGYQRERQDKSGRSLCITATDCFNRPGPASAKTGLPWLTMNVLRRIRYDGNPQIIFVYDVSLYAAKRLTSWRLRERVRKCWRH